MEVERRVPGTAISRVMTVLGHIRNSLRGTSIVNSSSNSNSSGTRAILVSAITLHPKVIPAHGKGCTTTFPRSKLYSRCNNSSSNRGRAHLAMLTEGDLEDSKDRHPTLLPVLRTVGQEAITVAAGEVVSDLLDVVLDTREDKGVSIRTPGTKRGFREIGISTTDSGISMWGLSFVSRFWLCI